VLAFNVELLCFSRELRSQLIEQVIKRLVALGWTSPPVEHFDESIAQFTIQSSHFEKPLALEARWIIDSDKKTEEVTTGPALTGVTQGNATEQIEFFLRNWRHGQTKRAPQLTKPGIALFGCWFFELDISGHLHSLKVRTVLLHMIE
jgi:hypothetical protein